MEINTFNLILGSQSPRRKELMQWSYLPFSILVSDVEEISHFKRPKEIAADLALLKARATFALASDKFQNPFVIGADTIVVLNDKLLGKPVNIDDARNMLKQLSGQSHTVMTGVAFKWQNEEHVFVEKTKVTFGDITDDLLEHYLLTNESLDKAGSYGIQGAALGFIKSVEGSYSNVVGLPIDCVIENMKMVLGHQEDKEGKWRSLFISG